MADRTLKRVLNISDPNHKQMEKRKAHLPCSVGTTLKPLKSALEGLIDFLQGKPLPRAAVDCQLDKGRIWIIGFFARGGVIEDIKVDRLVSIHEAQ